MGTPPHLSSEIQLVPSGLRASRSSTMVVTCAKTYKEPVRDGLRTVDFCMLHPINLTHGRRRSLCSIETSGPHMFHNERWDGRLTPRPSSTRKTSSACVMLPELFTSPPSWVTETRAAVSVSTWMVLSFKMKRCNQSLFCTESHSDPADRHAACAESRVLGNCCR